MITDNTATTICTHHTPLRDKNSILATNTSSNSKKNINIILLLVLSYYTTLILKCHLLTSKIICFFLLHYLVLIRYNIIDV